MRLLTAWYMHRFVAQEAEARRRESEAASSSASLDISGEEAYLRRAQMSGMSAPDSAQGDAQGAAKGDGMTFAQRMMNKMGWKEV